MSRMVEKTLPMFHVDIFYMLALFDVLSCVIFGTWSILLLLLFFFHPSLLVVVLFLFPYSFCSYIIRELFFFMDQQSSSLQKLLAKDVGSH